MILDKKKIDVWFISDLFECLEDCHVSGNGNGWISISNRKNTLIDYYEETRTLCVYIENIDTKTNLSLDGFSKKYKLNHIVRSEDE
tara:strand:- start:251 stop:508 length:258 start_codon:yes stop_codon:yes gene_type:complete